MDLKPCPFCGGKADVLWNYNAVWVECKACKASSRVAYATCEEEIEKIEPIEAIEAWNKRVEAK